MATARRTTRFVRPHVRAAVRVAARRRVRARLRHRRRLGAHVNPQWATDEQVATARALLDERGLSVGSYQVWVGADAIERACEIAGASRSRSCRARPALGRASRVAARGRGLGFAFENHPEKTPR